MSPNRKIICMQTQNFSDVESEKIERQYLCSKINTQNTLSNWYDWNSISNVVHQKKNSVAQCTFCCLI